MIAWMPLAAADITPYLKLIFLIVILSMTAINRLLSGLKKARSQLPPPGPDTSEPPAVSTARDEINAEVKEFLRRAAKQQSGPRPPQPPPVRPIPVSSDAGSRAQSHRPQKSKPAIQKPAASKPDDSIANRRVVSRLESHALDERAAQLTSLDKTNDIDAHVQLALDHQVGQLTPMLESSTASTSAVTTSAGSSDSANPLAAEIAALLRDPKSLRGAIVLTEVLTRPVDRW